jgi:hypothetical protein
MQFVRKGAIQLVMQNSSSALLQMVRLIMNDKDSLREQLRCVLQEKVKCMYRSAVVCLLQE